MLYNAFSWNSVEYAFKQMCMRGKYKWQEAFSFLWIVQT